MQDVETVVEIDKRGVATTLVEDMFNVNVGYGQSLVANKSLAGGDDCAVLGDDAVACEYQVGR